jgi:hypothetical protein
MFVLELPVSRFSDDSGGCMPESHPDSPSFDLTHPYGAGPGPKANGLAGSVPHTAERVRVLGRCGWTPVETTPADAGPGSRPASSSSRRSLTGRPTRCSPSTPPAARSPAR